QRSVSGWIKSRSSFGNLDALLLYDWRPLMQKIRRILFAADLSPQCRAVAPYVRAMANSFHSELVVLNALEAPSGYYKDWNAYLTLVNWEAIREDRQRRLSA